MARELRSPRSTTPVSIVVPTYREAAAIAALVERVATALRSVPFAWELLLVDDDSGDGIEMLAAQLAKRYPVRLHVRRAPPRDLARSVLLGLRLARFDRVVVMDADLSHPPECLPHLLAALDDGADMALGSRYAGGSVDPGWDATRALGSRIATALARPLTTCADPLSGLFAMDRRDLPPEERLRPGGYKIALEIMVRGGLQVREVPIHFRNREVGASKMNGRMLALYLGQLVRLYAFRLRAALGHATGDAGPP